jgi:hypothetical protein
VVHFLLDFLWSSSLCRFLQCRITSSLFGPNIFLLITKFSSTHSLRFSRNVRNQVSHPYKATGNIPQVTYRGWMEISISVVRRGGLATPYSWSDANAKYSNLHVLCYNAEYYMTNFKTRLNGQSRIINNWIRNTAANIQTFICNFNGSFFLLGLNICCNCRSSFRRFCRVCSVSQSVHNSLVFYIFLRHMA